MTPVTLIKLKISGHKLSSTILLISLFLFCFITEIHCQVTINEFLASNVVTNPENHDFDDYSDWLELYNSGDEPVDLEGYFLTDNLNKPMKWQIPPGTIIESKGFLLFWADGKDKMPGEFDVRPWTIQARQVQFKTISFHTSFKLSQNGEEIGLFDPDGNLVDKITFTNQWPDVSYGRKPDGASSWYLFGEPTPGVANTTEECTRYEFSGEAYFSLQGNLFESSQEISLSTSSPTAVIRYTIDGSSPGSSSPEYEYPLYIETTTVIRARVFEPGKLPGKITTQTYFINEEHDLPVLSIAAYPSTLWDNTIGIYENELKERVIPVSIEFFEPDKINGFKLDAGLRLSGEFSLSCPQKPFTIDTESRFGYDEILYQVFKNKPIGRFKSIYLRNSGYPDNFLTLFRDAMAQSLVIDKMDIDAQAYRPAVVYINGEYWGIYNIREKLNKDYLVSNHGVNRDNLDILEYWGEDKPVVVDGDTIRYASLMKSLEAMDITLPENYQLISSKIDIDEYMNYMISEIYFANWIWLNINIKWWSERTEHSKWRWMLFDTDAGFGTTSTDMNNIGYMHNTLNFALLSNGQSGSSGFTFLFRKLMENPRFKNEFIQRFASHLNTTFEKERVLNIIDSLKTNISNEMPRHINRWKYSYSTLDIDPIRDKRTWENNVEVMETFARQRPYFVRQHILSKFQLSGSATLKIDVKEPKNGSVYVNGVGITDTDKTCTYFKEIPLVLKAVPNVGYRFVEWLGIQDNKSDSVTFILDRDSSVTAVFEPNHVNIIPAEITEKLTLAKAGSPYATMGDIIVYPGANLTVEAGTQIFMAEDASIYVFGEIHLNGNEGNPIQIKANANTGAKQWGAICFKDATSSSTLSFVKLEQATKGKDLVYYKAAITAYNSDINLKNVEMLAAFPFFSKGGDIKISNCNFRSERIGDLINIRDADSARVENCDLKGNDLFDCDAIDFDNVSNGIIRGNKIYNFVGENSDGIDLGEGAKNILIEGNHIFNCTDKGISVGQASTAVISRNVIVNCAMGVGIKDFDSYALIDHNTFHNNVFGVACFEKNFLFGGANADITNSIFSNSLNSVYQIDNLSSINIDFSLANNMLIPGTENIMQDPLYVDANSFDFHLQAGSPCIDAGDPAGLPDSDGSRNDIGAFAYLTTVNTEIEESSTQLTIFPNPTRDFLNIRSRDTGIHTVAISSINGQLIQKREFYGSDFELNLTNCPSGVYLITVKSKGFLTTKKIIKH